MIRPATIRDLDECSTIEQEAGELFRPLGMDLVADDDPPTRADLEPYVVSGRAWVVEIGGDLAAYLVSERVDRCEHLEQVTVRPRYSRRRIGAALIEHVSEVARASGSPALTLTTFREVPWNGPYYLERGFRWLGDDELSPGLRAIRAAEKARGLDTWPRGCMRRELA